MRHIRVVYVIINYAHICATNAIQIESDSKPVLPARLTIRLRSVSLAEAAADPNLSAYASGGGLSLSLALSFCHLLHCN